jgi:hypothetical protein
MQIRKLVLAACLAAMSLIGAQSTHAIADGATNSFRLPDGRVVTVTYYVGPPPLLYV